MENRIIGERIARRRKTLGMTQKQLADRLHITDRAVSRWERGVGAPDLSLIVPLCEALSMSTDELLRGIPVCFQRSLPCLRADTLCGQQRLVPISGFL